MKFQTQLRMIAISALTAASLQSTQAAPTYDDCVDLRILCEQGDNNACRLANGVCSRMYGLAQPGEEPDQQKRDEE
ncbi:hypothetical protein [Rheinheimera texasensis]|uniref:hypothetical protein n=1 Tax=Rheinheimera texasensis TaxID=306205 RepID=UPI0032B1034B